MVAPGPTAFTVIPYCASSMARQRVKWSTAAFDTQYAPISQRGTLAAVEAVLTMRPAARLDHRRHDGLAAEEHALEVHVEHAPPGRRLDVDDGHRGQGDARVVHEDVDGAIRLAHRRHHRIDRRALAHVRREGRRLAAGATDAPATVSSALRWLTSATATRAPCRANVSAAARPMPEPAPVINTVLSSARHLLVLPQESCAMPSTLRIAPVMWCASSDAR